MQPNGTTFSDNVQVRGASMGMPHITKFCWCMGLVVGSKVIGYLHLVVSLVIVSVCAAVAGSARGLAGTPEDEDRVYSRLATVALVVAVVSVVHIFLAVTLIYAVHKRNMTCVRAWVVVMCALWVAALLYVLVSAAAFKPHTSGSDIFLAFLEGVVFFGIVAYCILCVNSYYLVLRSNSDMQGPGKQQY